MDDLTLMRDFGAERVEADPEARAAAFRALSARMEAEAAAARSFAAKVTGTEVPPLAATTRRGPSTRRRRALAFAGATALAALLAGIIVLRSGPTAQQASAATVLRQTAAVAAGSAPPAQVAGPDQLLYLKTEQEELQEWGKRFTASYGGVVLFEPEPTYGGLVRWREEDWMSNHRKGRGREVLGSISFLTAAERRRWKAAGSPAPGIFSGVWHGGGGERRLEVKPGVYDVEVLNGLRYGHNAGLPTRPAALRHEIERKVAGDERLRGATPAGMVISELWEILDRPNSSSALRAAVFGALAEEPGFKLDRHATDLAGRRGYALAYEGRKGDIPQPGIKVEYIFNPETSAVLGKREIVGEARRLRSVRARNIPSGTVIRDTAYLGYGVVDSPHRRPDLTRATGR